MLSDKPNRFFRGHPIQMIKSREVYRTRVAPQRAFAAQVEVNIEITHGQLAQSAIHGLAITASGEIRFRDCAPVPAHLEKRDHVIGVLFRFQIEDQWWETEDTKRGRPEYPAFEARRNSILQNFPW